MPSVQVSLRDRSYRIFVGKNLLSRAGALIRRRLTPRNALVVTQREVPSVHAQTLLRSLESEGFAPALFLTPASKSSEAAKSQAVYSKLLKKLVSSEGRHRSTVLIALGGGVIGDLTGFAASVYRRGIPYVQAPTTLTAQVDSAIGGKTGVDLPEGKNLLGTVYQPELVLSDVTALQTLPERHWTDGFAEVIKYGVIKDPSLFALLEKNTKDALRRNERLLEKVIYRCARIKAGVVAGDEFDRKGVRMVLNFGHTLGHALEAASRYTRQYTHGEAISVGMLMACDIAARMGVLRDEKLPERLEKVLLKFELPLFYKGLTQDSILKAMGYDKKSESGVNRFVLPERLGRTRIIRDVPETVIAEALQKRKA